MKIKINIFYVIWIVFIVIDYNQPCFHIGYLLLGTLVGIISGLVIMILPFMIIRFGKLSPPLNHILYGSFFLGALIYLISNMIPPTPEQYFKDSIQQSIPVSVQDIHYSLHRTHENTESVIKFKANFDDIQRIVKSKRFITLKENMNREFKINGRISITIESPDSMHILFYEPQDTSFMARNYFIEPYLSNKNNKDIRSWYNLSELNKPEIYVPLLPCEEIFMNSSKSNSEYLIYNKLTNTAYYFSSY
jgi:hypothetical protein